MIPFPSLPHGPTIAEAVDQFQQQRGPSVAQPQQRIEQQREGIIARLWPRGERPVNWF